jgi:hypothetical protein
MRILLVIGSLLITSPIYSSDLLQRIDAKVAVIDKTQTETIQKQELAEIVKNEIVNNTTEFSNQFKLDVNLDINTLDVNTPEISDFEYGIRELDKALLSNQEKEILRSMPSIQYPQQVIFPFIETIDNDPEIYWVDIRWANIVTMKEEIKDKDIKLAIFGVYEGTSIYNNFDLAEAKKKGFLVRGFPFYSKEFEIVYQAFKEVRPDVPIGFIVVNHPSLADWLASFTIKPDCWVLFNVGTFNSNWRKVKSWFGNTPVIANLNFGVNSGQKYNSYEYKVCIGQLRDVGFSGSIWWRR